MPTASLGLLELNRSQILPALPAGASELDCRRLLFLFAESLDPSVQQRLDQATLTFAQEFLDPAATLQRSTWGSGEVVSAETSAGHRELSAGWAVACEEDSDDGVIGLCLWDRYAPAVLDWKFPHGGSGSPFRLDFELTTQLERARQLYAAAYPPLTGAPFTLAENFF